MPSTTRRLSANGRPRRPAFEGSNGSIRSHCSSVNTRYREPVDLTPPDCREPPAKYWRHALGTYQYIIRIGYSVSKRVGPSVDRAAGHAALCYPVSPRAATVMPMEI